MSIARVHYRERQRLTTADLRAEQGYRLALAGRHHLAHHDWGVVRGLRVVENEESGFTLAPGLAIDGYGREILVTAPVDLPIALKDLAGCLSILLYYCEYPAQVPPTRACKDEPAPRIAQKPRVVAAGDVPAAGTFEDLAQARGAGPVPGVFPWPVPVARVGMTCSSEEDTDLVVYRAARYVRHRAALVRTPTRRTLLKVGLENRTDVYHVLISTAGPDGSLAPRLGVDRDRVVHVWKPLVVTGAEATGSAAIASNKLLRISAPMPGGIGRRLRIVGGLDPGQRLLSASLEELGPIRLRVPPASFAAEQPIRPNAPLSETINFGGVPAAFKLLDPGSLKPVPLLDGRPPSLRRARRAREEPTVPTEAFSILLGPAGGELNLKRPADAQQVEIIGCGDVDRTRGEGTAPGMPVVQLKPAAAAVDDPLAREIYAVTTSLPTDPVPRTDLRVSGGAEDKSDVSTRVSFGARHADSAFVPRLRMDGGRRIDILAGATDRPALQVDGTVYLPPIGKDDPLLPEMLSMAFMAGLRQAGRLGDTTATLEDVPASIVRGSTLQYKLKVDYPDGTVLRRPVELILGTAGVGDLAFRTIPGDVFPDDPLPDGQAPKTFDITLPNFTHRASEVKLQVVLLVGEKDAARIVVAAPKLIEVQ